jgi:hypothetical protein
MEPANVVFPDSIAPGEAILAVVGIRPLLTDAVERITAPMWREISQLGRTVHQQAVGLVRGNLDRAKAYPAVDYDSALKAFSAPPAPAQIEAMLRDVPAGADLPFLAAAARAYNYLRGEYPICVERTVFGVNQLEPGDFAMGRFEDQLEIIDRPLSVFGMIESGRLTTKQAAAMQGVYPTLYKEIAVDVVSACMQEKADHPSWEPEFGRGLSVLLGVPGIDPNLRAQLAAAPPPAAPPDQQRMAATKSRRAHLIATKSDRLELDE